MNNERCVCIFKYIGINLRKAAQIMKNQTNMTLPKEINEEPVTDPKEMKIYDLCDLGAKIIILKKLEKMQENQIDDLKKIPK